MVFGVGDHGPRFTALITEQIQPQDLHMRLSRPCSTKRYQPKGIRVTP